MSDGLGYRPCVGVMLVNSDGKVFVGRRIDNKEGDWWQMPQGGVDDGALVQSGAQRLAGLVQHGLLAFGALELHEDAFVLEGA